MHKPSSGKGRVLVMDDEEMVRQVASRLLMHLGYEVESAEDGSRAVDMFERAAAEGRPYDLLLMDLTVPGGMGGKEAMKHLLEIDPEVKVIVSSGYSNDPVMANYQEYGFRAVVVKPYDLTELGDTVHRVLSMD